MPATIERKPAAPTKSLSGEKAQRIIEAMRRCVARRGTAGSTFERVAREAGVSRGLLHYYFGTKEQLLVEAVRRDCELRMERWSAAGGRADRGGLRRLDGGELDGDAARRSGPRDAAVRAVYAVAAQQGDRGGVRRADALDARAGGGDARGRAGRGGYAVARRRRRRWRRSCSRWRTASRCGCSPSRIAISARRCRRASSVRGALMAD